VCSTWRAHRLLLLAWKKGGSEPQTKLLNALYQASFERSENVGDIDILAGLAEETGLMSKEEVSLPCDPIRHVTEIRDGGARLLSSSSRMR
jgi:predicted DsbA family dithiol-disulfide isomerase